MKPKLITIVNVFSILNHIAVAQINGEFWWLNSKLAAITGVEAPNAKYEELDELANDEADKVVFKSVDVNSNKDFEVEIPSNRDESELSLQFELPKQETFKDPNNNIISNNNSNYILKQNNKTKDLQKNNTKKSGRNIIFSFPTENPNEANELHHHQIFFPSEDNEDDFKHYVSKYRKRNTDNLQILKFQPDLSDVEYICNFISYGLCNLRRGFVYEDSNRHVKNDIYLRKKPVCCIFPISNTNTSPKVNATKNNNHKYNSTHKSQEFKIRFPRSVKLAEDTENRGQKQRESLMKKLFVNVKPLPTVQTKVKKIVSDYDYVDPYWNIKSTNLKAMKSPKPTSDPYAVIYDSVESEEHYASEIPKPGWLGSYSAQNVKGPLQFSWAGNKRPSQTFNGGSTGSGYNNGYPTLDPRLDVRTTIIKRPKPIESSSEEIFDAESHIVTYQANPDFQVLQDFKLLNLIRNKSRLYDRNSKKSTTEKVSDYDSLESTRPGFGSSSTEVDYDDDNDENNQLYKDCGRRTIDYDTVDEDSVGRFGAHPWILLIVRTRNKHRTLCSATLIHPRAAITAAICVNGATSGEVVVRAGEWDLQQVGHSQQRLASVLVHQLYQDDSLNHNLAILHWSRPLRLTAGIQPACLGDPEAGSTCNFVGWGGVDQSIRSRPKVQHATISKRRPCANLLNNPDLFTNMPENAFCAITDDSNCVSGVGASLLCTQKGRVATVGVTVWRSKCDGSPQILLQSRRWITRTLTRLGIS